MEDGISLVSCGVAGMWEDASEKGELNGWKNRDVVHTLLLADGQKSDGQFFYYKITFIELGVYLSMCGGHARSTALCSLLPTKSSGQ